MDKTNKILQYHIDNNYKRLKPGKIVGLSDKQKDALQKQLDLHHKLSAIMVRKARGYAAFEASLRAVGDTESSTYKSFFVKYRLQFVSLGALALIVVGSIGGLTGFRGNSTNQASNSQSAIQANGSLDNFSELTILDAQADAQVSTADENAIATAKSELSSVSNLDGGINASF